MQKPIKFFLLLSLYMLAPFIFADSYVIENHKLQVEKKKFGKEIINLQTDLHRWV